MEMNGCRQGIGFSSEIEIMGEWRGVSGQPEVARGLASRLRLK